MNCKLIGVTLLALSPLAATAQENTRFNWEASLEFGADSTLKSDVAVDELTDVYETFEASGALQLTDRVSLFSTVTIESMTGATSNRAFEDMGFYVNELGLSFSLGDSTVSVGKISPAFGMAWDTAPGFYGTAFAEDYELAEMIGISAEFALGCQ